MKMNRKLTVVGLATLTSLATVTLGGALVGASSAGADTARAVPRFCEGQRATILGTANADTLRGTNGRDVIVSFAGNDTIRGRGGNDIICAGAGADDIRGGPGADRMHGGLDQHGVDRGGSWRIGDTLMGGPGNDFMDPGFDRPGGANVYLPDSVDYTAAARGVVADLADATVRGEGRDTYVVSRNVGIVGSSHADTIRGSDRADSIAGGAGDDLILGNGGNDELFPEGMSSGGPHDHDEVHGGAGDDTIDSRRGRDLIYGDDGADNIASYSNRASKVYAGPGNDLVAQNAVKEPGFVSDPGTGVDDLTLYTSIAKADVARRTWLRVDVGAGTIRLGDGPAGTISPWDEISFADETKVEYKGSAAADHVFMAFGGPLRAWTYGGNDDVSGSTLNDRIDAGDGQDDVGGYLGWDTCLNAERATSCEG